MSLEPGLVIGRGRGSVIYDLGDGTVLRRYLNSTHAAAPEAEAMRLAAAAGVPVPVVHSAVGPDLRMDLVSGPTMLAELIADPERAESYGRVLAELHRRLNAVKIVEAPGLVHGDVHPGNVVMATSGPVLLDWTNFLFAERALDLALTWLVLACFDPPSGPLVQGVRERLLAGLFARDGRSAAASHLEDAAAVRCSDPATTLAEKERIEQLVADYGSHWMVPLRHPQPGSPGGRLAAGRARKRVGLRRGYEPALRKDQRGSV